MGIRLTLAAAKMLGVDVPKLPRPAGRRGPSDLELDMAEQIRRAKLPKPEAEFRFCDGRRWRFDFAWPHQRVALEVEGGVFSHGRHTRGAGFTADAEKYNVAALSKWIVLRVTAEHVKSGRALEWLTEALTEEPPQRRPRSA